MDDRAWTRCADRLPDCGVVVATKIDDANGCRNEQTLKRYQRTPATRSLWFLPDGSMYVYYEPTHWRPADGADPATVVTAGGAV